MSTQVNINPDRIKHARKLANISLKDFPEKIRKWEMGESAPTLNELKEFSKIVNCPVTFFFNSSYETVNLDKLFNQEISENLKEELLFSMFRRNKYREFSVNEIPDFYKLYFRKEDVFLPIIDYNDILYLMEDILANFGLLVFESMGVGCDEFNGCSYYFDNVPIILLNGGNSYEKRVSSLIKGIDYINKKKSKIYFTEDEFYTNPPLESKFFKYNGYAYSDVILDAYDRGDLSKSGIVKCLRMPFEEIKRYL